MCGYGGDISGRGCFYFDWQFRRRKNVEDKIIGDGAIFFD